MGKGEFVLNVADLLQRPGARRHERLAAPVAEMRVVDTAVPAGSTAEIDALLEWVSEGVLVTGRVGARWVGSCRRCLGPVEGRVEAHVRELFVPQPVEGETYKLAGDRIDLAPLVRESVLIELPLAPVCREDCAGLCPTCGADRNAGACECGAEPADPRWAALDNLFERGLFEAGPFENPPIA